MSLIDLALAGRLMVAAVLVVAGVRKIGAVGRPELAAAIRNYGIVPARAVGVVAATLPWLELSIGVLMAAGVLLTPASICAALILCIFSGMVAWHTWRGGSFSCGCGGGGRVRWSLALRDLGLGLLAAGVAVYPHDALAIWAGPAWFRADSTAWPALIPVPMTMLLLAVCRRLITVGAALVPGPPRAPLTRVRTD